MMDSFMPKQIYNSKRQYIQLKTPYEASLKEELDFRGSRISHKAFTFLCDVMKQLQNDEDLWKENMVKSPVYGNRIRLYICSNILKGIVLIHRHRLLKLLNDVTNPRVMTFNYNRRFVKVKIVEPLSKNNQIRLVSQISQLPSQQQIQNTSPIVGETSTVIDVHPVPSHIIDTSHTATEIPSNMIQTIAEVHPIPLHIAEEMRHEALNVERKNELSVEIYQTPEQLATPLVASGFAELVRKSTVQQPQLHESVETMELQDSIITELAPSKQQPQLEIAREFGEIMPANLNAVSDMRNIYELSSIAAKTDQLTTVRSAIPFNDIDLIETETEYLARIQKAEEVPVVFQRNGRRSAFADHRERPILHELITEAEIHEIPTSQKAVEKPHECMDETVTNRRELLIEPPFNASIEPQSSVVPLIQEHLEDIREIPEREKDKILMETDKEQVNISSIEPVTIERTGATEQKEQEAGPVEEPLPLLRDVVDRASHEENSMENARVFEGRKSIHFTERIMKNRLNRKGIQKSYVSPTEIIDMYQEQQYHLLDPCRIIFDDDVLDINDLATYIDPDYFSIFIDEIDYHKIPLDEFHSDCWSIQFSDHHRTSEIFTDKDTRREIENDRQLLDVLRKSTGGQVVSPRFSFPFQGLTSAREKAKKSSIFNILLPEHEQSDIVELITSISSLNGSFGVEAPRVTDVPRIVGQVEETIERPFQIGRTSARPELREKIVTTDQAQKRAFITDAEAQIAPVSFLAEPQKEKIEDVTIRMIEKNQNVMRRLEEMEHTFREPVAEEIVPAQAPEFQHDKARDVECPDIPWLRKSIVTGVPILEEQEDLTETPMVRRRIRITKADVFRKISDLIESAEIAPIRFSDVCPAETTSRLIAAATFSRLLGLYADKQIILHQDLGRMSPESILIYPV